MRSSITIGCGAGFWGDTPEGPGQIVESGVDYLVLDYLAEITMSILTRMKQRDDSAGYATDFVSLVMRPLARRISARGIRVVTNAGGVNPRACRDALMALFGELGVDLKVAIVEGDDLLHHESAFRSQGVREMFGGAPFPAACTSMNAYLGAFPIAAALARGADIVITGRCVDSALALGPLIHEFGWKADDHDLLSAGSLAGHLIECGVQATGGVFTDWRETPGWDRMGFPIVACRPDGSFELYKPEGTGGLVSPATVGEQLVYEVGDPRAYLLPDVCCDWSSVRLEQAGPDRVRVTGARGAAPGIHYKVSATWQDGFRLAGTMMVAGDEAVQKAEAVGEAIIRRAARLMAEQGFAPFSETSIEVLGSEANYGRHARTRSSREVVLKIAARHAQRGALDVLAREIYPAATAMAQGITGFAGGRPKPQPVVRLFSFLAPKALARITVNLAGDACVVASDATPPHVGPPARNTPPPPPAISAQTPGGVLADGAGSGRMTFAPLRRFAHGRSGDKGDIANIGILARKPGYVPWLRASLTPEAIAACLAHVVEGPIDIFEWPGINGFNILLHQGLGGGGVASLRYDPQGKALAQVLLDMPVAIPAAWTGDDDAPARSPGISPEQEPAI